MMINRNFGALAVLLALVGLAFGLGACGAQDQSPNTTPESGDNTATTTDDVFIADASNPDDLARLFAMEEIPVEELGEIETHRGSSDKLATVYWPQKNVTLDGLASFRIDVGAEYDGDGRLEFRKGTKVLYSEPFDPDNVVTVGAVPQSVIDAIKKGSSVKWGIFFEGRDKKNSVYGTFKVVSGVKASRRLKKLEGSKNFLRQPPQVRELMKTQVLQNYKLYSESLVQYLGILNVWPEISSPYKGIVETCRRLDLDETPLFALASEHVRGSRKMGRTTANQANRAALGNNTPGNSVDVGNAPLNVETTAPPLQQRTSDGPKPLGSGHGVAPPEQTFESDPTDPSGVTEPSVPVDPSAQEAALREQWGVLYTQLDSQASAAEAMAAKMAADVERLKATTEELERTTAEAAQADADAAATEADLETAVQAHDAAVAALEADPGNASKQQDVLDTEQAKNAAQDAHEQTSASQNQAHQNMDRASANHDQAQDAAGGVGLEVLEQMASDVQTQAAEMREQAEAYKAQLELEFATPEQRVGFEQAARLAEQQAAKAEAQNVFNQTTEGFLSAMAAAQAAGDALLAAQAALDADPGNAAKAQALDEAEQALVSAQEEVMVAENSANAARAALEELGVDPNTAEQPDPGAGG